MNVSPGKEGGPDRAFDPQVLGVHPLDHPGLLARCDGEVQPSRPIDQLDEGFRMAQNDERRVVLLAVADQDQISEGSMRRFWIIGSRKGVNGDDQTAAPWAFWTVKLSFQAL